MRMLPRLWMRKNNSFIFVPKLKRYSFDKLGKNVRFISLKNVFNSQNIQIGDNSYLGRNIYIDAIQPIKIGNNVQIGPNVVMISASHNFEYDLKALPYDNKFKKNEIIIHDNVWICANVVIKDGIEIGEGAIVGIGSVVIKDVPPCAIVGGNPARIIKYRDIEVYNKLKKENKFFYNEFYGSEFEFYDDENY